MDFSLQIKPKKPDTFVSGSIVAPPIGESYNFDAMISYSIILKSKV